MNISGEVESILERLSEHVNRSGDNLLLQELSAPSLSLPQPWVIFFLILYILTALASIIGNIMVVLAVYRTPSLQTEGNFYMVSLAVSDCLLVSVAAPATLTQLFISSWPFQADWIGSGLCVMTGFFPVFLSFMSTFSIICISLDRHRLIVHSSNKASKHMRMKIAVGLCWILAFLFASPLLKAMQVLTHSIPVGQSFLARSYCIENWDFNHGRLFYSLVLSSIQLILPSLIISLAHLSINRRLTHLPFPRPRVRLYRTQRLLITIVVVFTVSWLPLNLINLLLDLDIGDKLGIQMSDQQKRILFAAFHLIGMSSSVSNPIIYGYFNTSFRKVYSRMIFGGGRKSPSTTTNRNYVCVNQSRF
ncbi:neuropeptide F receptor [Eurytemora carolleeae]|uniref:neuropeptide F receptor n=1 Tax=Eurytemora carolleeae TaxID=1294199 RepID=UPI000C78866D|nr:neuropeptide F receptor [Eurytemora carolleeae]|eukprot:XP_023323264.1 neuropeptide F receptor-like [Eurytemora affinis]